MPANSGPTSMSISEIETFGESGLAQSLESQSKLFSALNGLVGFSKQQSDRIMDLQVVVEQQKEQLKVQSEMFALTVKEMSHKLRMVEYRIDGHDFDPEMDKSDEELDSISAEYFDKKNSGYFEKLEEEKAAEQAARDAQEAEAKRLQEEVAEKERQEMEQKREADAELARQALQTKADELILQLEAIEKRARDDQTAAEEAATRAQASAAEAKAQAKARAELRVTPGMVNSMISGIASEMEKHSSAPIEVLRDAITAVLADEMGCPPGDLPQVSKALADIADRGVGRAEGEAEEMIEEARKTLCTAFDVTYRKPRVAAFSLPPEVMTQMEKAAAAAAKAAAPAPVVAPAPVPFATSTPIAAPTPMAPAAAQVPTQAELAAEATPGDTSSAAAENSAAGGDAGEGALTAAPTTTEAGDRSMHEFMVAMNERLAASEAKAALVPADLAHVMTGVRDLLERDANGSLGGGVEVFKSPPAPTPLPFEADTVVRYIDGALPESLVDDMRNALRLSDIVAELNISKAGSDELAGLKKGVAELSDQAVKYPDLDAFADLGTSKHAGQVLNASIKLREALIKEVKTNVDFHLTNLRTEIEDKNLGSRAFTKLEVQRAEDHARHLVDEERDRAVLQTGLLGKRVDEMNQNLATFGATIEGLMWTKGAQVVETDEVVKEDVVDTAKLNEQIRLEMQSLEERVASAIQEQQYNVDRAQRRAEVAERGVSEKATNERVETLIAELVNAFNSSMDTSVTELRGTMRDLGLALQRKAGREEVLGLFNTQRKNLGGADEEDNPWADGPMAAGSTHCVSCGRAPSRGSNHHRSRSPHQARAGEQQGSATLEGTYESGGMSTTLDPGHVPSFPGGSSVAFDDNISPPASAPSSQEMVSSKMARPGQAGMQDEVPPRTAPATVVLDKTFVEKYNDVMRVVSGQAGLQSMHRHSSPMKPKIHPYLKKSQQPPEPLYRRAKLVQSIRESSKTGPPRSAPNLSRSAASAIIYEDPARRREGTDLLPALPTTIGSPVPQGKTAMFKGQIYPINANMQALPVGVATSLPGQGDALDELSLGSGGGGDGLRLT